MDEFDIIARYFRPLSNDKNGLGLMDDAALLQPKPGYDLVVTTDAIVAGVHFHKIATASDIAEKVMAVNISDIIAKGAEPKYYLLTLALPSDINQDWLQDFSKTLKQQQAYYGCTLIGGDSVSTSGSLMVSITMVGEVKSGAMVKRSTAQKGDLIYVSGTIGDAVLGLELCDLDSREDFYALPLIDKEYCLNRYLCPEPERDLIALVSGFARAAMDISDGLVGDLEKLCKASGKGAKINLSSIPVLPSLQQAVSKDFDLLTRLVTGGDDYQVLMTVPPSKAEALKQAAKKNKVMLTEIGIITDSAAGFNYYDGGGNSVIFDKKSYNHF